MTPKAAKAAADSVGASPADSDDTDAARHIAEGAALLNSATPAMTEFYRALYRDATTEDLARYDAASLAELASEAFARSAARRPGEPLVELFAFKASGRDLVRNETVLLAVNDDMPFLFDSLIGEVSAQGARVRALFHPIIAVSRDAEGHRGRGTAIRESVIVLVLAPVTGKERQEALVKGAM
ncbi:MAG: NAD-glutamate dehydrogenase, partial [Pseudomonadota bacterium]|nr:NAD-glutamate dehydrogenase [Pseudomonadota bacterium]